MKKFEGILTAACMRRLENPEMLQVNTTFYKTKLTPHETDVRVTVIVHDKAWAEKREKFLEKRRAHYRDNKAKNLDYQRREEQERRRILL